MSAASLLADPDSESGPARKEEPTVVLLAPIEVTGSLIQTAEAAGTMPLKLITRSEMEQAGLGSVSEFLQQLPEAGYSSNTEGAPALGSSYRGLSALNLRGLDPGNTLVLVDGRRPVSSGIGWNGTVITDLNRFPLAMVERVEVLQDAGAIYGSGAAAGVVNIILRKHVRGTEFSARYGNSFRTDVGERSFAVLTSGEMGGTSYLLGLTYYARSGLRAADTDFASNADLNDRYAAKGPAYADRVAAGAFDLRSSVGPQARIGLIGGQRNGVNGVNIPGLAPNALITRLPGTGGVPAGTMTSVTPSFTAPAIIGTGGRFDAAAAASFVAPILTKHTNPSNYYNATGEFMWLMPRVERSGAQLSLRHDFSPRVTAYATLACQHNWSTIEGTPMPTSAEVVAVPKTNYWNPFGVDVVAYWLPVEMGPRLSNSVDETVTALLGARGGAGAGGHWDTAVSYGWDRNFEIMGNYISRDGLKTVLARTTPEALNVFGGATHRNPAATIDAMRGFADKEGVAQTLAWDGRISGDLLDLPSGVMRGGLYAEIRREDFGDRWRTNDIRTLLGNYFDWGDPDADRTSGGLAAELQAPLVRKGEHPRLHAADLSISARFDRYSDGFNSGVKPCLGLRVQPKRWLTLRASLARSFRAPTLPQLFGGASDQTGYFWDDRRRPFALTGDVWDGSTNPRLAHYPSNPDLLPAHARSWQAGFVLDVPGRWLRGLSLGATYSKIEEINSITHTINNQGFVILNEVGGGTAAFIERDAGTETYTNKTSAPIPVLSGPDGATTPVAPGEMVTVPGRIRSIAFKFINLGLARTENCDFSLSYVRTLAPLGRFQLRSSVSYAVYMGSAIQSRLIANKVGQDNYPRVRMQHSLAWERGGWSAVATQNYIGPYGDLNRGNKVEVDAYATYGAQLAREFAREGDGWLAGTRLAVGVDNAFDQDPPLDYSSTGFRYGSVRRPYGRFFYVELRRTY